MSAKLESLERPRKPATQARARATVDTILEAATRILEREGRVALNTNAIATLAGVSIGTLYHHFAGKDAILIALARREIGAHKDAVLRALSGSSMEVEADRRVIRALLGAFDQRLNARRVATETLIAAGLSDELAAPVREAAKHLRSNDFFGGRSRPLSDASLFVLTRAISGTVNAAVRESSQHFGAPELEEELVQLIRRFVAPDVAIVEPMHGSRPDELKSPC